MDSERWSTWRTAKVGSSPDNWPRTFEYLTETSDRGRDTLATVFGHVFLQAPMCFEARLVGLAGNFTEPRKFSRWDDTSGGLGHCTDTD